MPEVITEKKNLVLTVLQNSHAKITFISDFIISHYIVFLTLVIWKSFYFLQNKVPTLSKENKTNFKYLLFNSPIRQIEGKALKTEKCGKAFIMPPHSYFKPYLGIRMETQSLTINTRAIKQRESYKYTYIHKCYKLESSA